MPEILRLEKGELQQFIFWHLMRSIIAVLFVFCFHHLACAPVMAQENWVLKKNEKGIAVYSRNMANEKHKQIKVVCELDGTTEKLLEIIRDVENYKAWSYMNKKTVLLKKKNDNNFISYTETAMPWPLANRDLVVETTIIPNSEEDLLRIEIKSVPDFLPKKPNLLRIPYSLAVWEVKPLPNNKLQVEYTLSVDPGGSVPDWLVNATEAIGPYNTFLKLRELLAKN